MNDKDQFKVLLGYGPFDTNPGQCWGVRVVSTHNGQATASRAMNKAYEDGIRGNPEAQYLWVQVFADGHPLMAKLLREAA